MKIAGLQKVSLIDYPGKVAAVIFTQGCNLRCVYCHNPELVYPERFAPTYALAEVFDFFETRRGKLQGAVVTGGEPTLQAGLLDFITRLKAMGYCVKLDTNGTVPEVIRVLLAHRLLDYVAMDIKAPLDKYTAVCKVEVNPDIITESLALIENSGIAHHFRLTFDQSCLDRYDLELVKKTLRRPESLVVQECISFDK